MLRNVFANLVLMLLKLNRLNKLYIYSKYYNEGFRFGSPAAARLDFRYIVSIYRLTLRPRQHITPLRRLDSSLMFVLIASQYRKSSMMKKRTPAKKKTAIRDLKTVLRRCITWDAALGCSIYRRHIERIYLKSSLAGTWLPKRKPPLILGHLHDF